MNNLELMKKRLEYQGGTQEGRMIKGKYLTFKKALLYSYQAAEISKLDSEEIYKVLINPDKNSTNYDDKILSIDYKFNIKPGDIFQWIGTSTYWIVYLPELTEDAYFRSQIRRCRYELFWIDMDQEKDKRKFSSYAYIRGPVETKINSTSKNNIVIDNPNLSLEIYLPKNEATVKHFNRYQKFAFDNRVWEVQTVDSISTEGILQIIAEEDFSNNQLDDLEKEKVTDAFYIAPVSPQNTDDILGETFIKPLGNFQYKLNSDIPTGGIWYIEKEQSPVSLTELNDSLVQITWTTPISGQFTLVYKINDLEYKKTIIVESLF